MTYWNKLLKLPNTYMYTTRNLLLHANTTYHQSIIFFKKFGNNIDGLSNVVGAHVNEETSDYSETIISVSTHSTHVSKLRPQLSCIIPENLCVCSSTNHKLISCFFISKPEW